MNKSISDNYTATANMNDEKIKEDYASYNKELDQKCFRAWSPLEENKFLFKQKYISCSRSVPRRSKRFIRYKISRSLNFEANVHSSSSENSSFEEDKHLSRSAKIMRALNCNSSPSYYGKTKIKKSLNFNLTPSPKRFMPTKKSIRKALSLNFNSPLTASNKCLNFDDHLRDCTDNSLLYTSSESIDENQNETPLQEIPEECGILHYSTPNTKLNKRSFCSAVPSLRSQLKETIDDIVCITATPNSQSLKRIKGKLDEATSTSRNLFYEFYDNNNDRASTPENVIDIVPESTSAIKRSHKKERSSRRNERDPIFLNSLSRDESIFENSKNSALPRYVDDADSLNESIDQYSSRNIDLKRNSGNQSDTGSLFDYAEEEENSIKEFLESSNCDNVSTEVLKFADVNEVKSDENAEISMKIEGTNEKDLSKECNDIHKDDLSDRNVDIKIARRSATPESTTEVLLKSQVSVTPENRINFLQNILKDSIKKSHKKNKDDNKKKLFNPKILRVKSESLEPKKDVTCWDESEQDESEEASVRHKHCDTSKEERASTPERVNSSRLLLSQYSSVKKSHKKDKHNKILSGFLKRQEYFNKEIDLCQNNADNAIEWRNNKNNSTEEVSSNLDDSENMKGIVCLDRMTCTDDTSQIKLSPSKRRRSLNVSLDCETNVLSHDSELQEADTSKEEFKIFTPLKRKRSLIGSTVKEYLHFYDLPSGKNELSEDIATNVHLSRCLTPVLTSNFRDDYAKTEETDHVTNENSVEAKKSDSIDINGRSTPRDMSTTELYVNVDSIKKSHKKNKRGNSSRKSSRLFKKDGNMEDEEQTSVKSMKEQILVHSNDCSTMPDVNKSFDSDNQGQISSDSECNEQLVNVTPPSSLKFKNYIKLIQETSIKRSHKKVRDKKKQEFIVDTNELSDDGSIFGDDEQLASDKDA